MTTLAHSKNTIFSKIFLLTISLLQLNSTTSWSYEYKKFLAKDYPNELVFSKKLQEKYDFIAKDWSFPDDKTIELNAYYFPKKEAQEIPASFQYKNNLKANNVLNNSNVNYINIGIPLLFATYGALFWDWGKISGFRTKDEGWFGKDTYAGGADKLAHMYSHYLLTRGSYYLYRTNGLSRPDALKHSVILAGTVGTLIEIGDGLSHYGFAINDLISDFVGIGLGHLLNTHAYLDELIGIQFWWWNNPDAPEHKGQKYNDPIDDYNNQKYIFNIRFAAIPLLRDFLPTRYINLDIGIYSRGYKDAQSEDEDTKRVLYTGLSLNLSQLLKDLFPKSDYAFYSSNVFKYYQPPMTGFEAQSWADRD